MPPHFFAPLCLLFLLSLSPLSAQDARRVQLLRDFDDGQTGGLSPINFWRWTDAEKKAADTFSRIELLADPDRPGKVFQASIQQNLPKTADFYPLFPLVDYLPPEAEALRMRVKVVTGKFELTAGSPTVYFGNSDAYTKTQILEPGDWRTIELSLIRDLWRNYRRPIFSRESPLIYYTRWVQEPMRIMVSSQSWGEIWIDDVELIGRGEGKPFPVFPKEAVKSRQAFDLAQAFTYATDSREFDLSYTPGKEAMRKPAVLRHEGDVLHATLRGIEEMSFIAIPAAVPAEANAFRITLTLENEIVGERGNVLDVVPLIAPKGQFSWDRFRPSAEQLASGKTGFSYCLSPERTEGSSWGFYHARRPVPNRERTELVIPFADFICASGTGELRDRHQKQQPLAAGEIVAVALLTPFGQGRVETAYTIEKVEAVTVAGNEKDWVSYPQADLSKLTLERRQADQGGRAFQSGPR